MYNIYFCRCISENYLLRFRHELIVLLIGLEAADLAECSLNFKHTCAHSRVPQCANDARGTKKLAHL